ncbi:cell death abnormality protein 1-like [Mya arenaria]|uniref:cell death abnormality protein 1-like n=1 Tax=Mya arenaria TaxID=6604 RepID=UPI0022E5417B|nr:cell death abnormality protein 1-like [Mya arenaria]
MEFASIILVLLVLLTAKCDSCPGRCLCCMNDICGTDSRGMEQTCLEGCKDGYHQPRCMWPCPDHCQTCRQSDGVCQTCQPGFYAPSNNCSSACDYTNCACVQSICDNCLDGFYDVGSHCDSVCSKGCSEEKCNDDGTCECKANFEGNECDVCVIGKYGENCNINCNNENCRCIDSTHCISCRPGYFDLSTFCSKQCSVGCKDICSNEGHCTCLSQFSGRTCENCKPGYHGKNCNTPCSNGCINGMCNRDGSCKCSPNFTGRMCETCVARQYGFFCDTPCGQGCTDNTCYKDDGTCNCEFNYKGALCNTCNDGYFGNLCNSICPDRCFNCSTSENCYTCNEGNFGLDCSLNCSANCVGSICGKSNGLCLDGCLDGFTADSCNDSCDGFCKTCSQTNSTYCTSCFDGFSGSECKCIPNCRCELNSEVCNECTNGFEMKSKDCKCNRSYCLNSMHCTTCQNNKFYTFNDTCCECNKLCKNKQCSSETHCLIGCDDGYTGANCADLCTDYDHDCTKCSQNEHFCVQCKGGLTPNTDGVCAVQCRETCVNKECDAKTGRCHLGCIRNFYADKCDLVCPSTCASVPNKTRCDNYGRCLHGCIEGYNGVTCVNATTTNTCDSSAAGIVGGAVGGASTIIIVIIGIVLCIQRRKQQKKQSESGSQVRFSNHNPFIIEEQERHYQKLSDRHNTTARVQDEAYTELQTNSMDYERVDS